MTKMDGKIYLQKEEFMERLTVPAERLPDGKTRMPIIDARKVEEHAMEIYWRLKAYEDTGLTPEQVVNLKSEPRWIPVTERLPDHGINVLVCVTDRIGNVKLEQAYLLAEYCIEDGWILEMWPEVEAPNVTHWRPLPELPKGE